jgi:diguanylate cyclase (GGDEF)-like protein/PAS domain S-box-containing protein
MQTLSPADTELLLDSVLDQAFNSVVITDASFDNGGPLIVKCNPAFSHMTGYSMDELIGQSPRILQGPDTDPAVIRELRCCLHEGRFFQGSTVNYRKDGTPYYVEWNISPIHDGSGKVRNFVSLQQNITPRVQAERERNLLAQALNVAKDPVLITDADAHIVFANQAFESVSGYSEQEVLGQTPKFLRSGQQDDSFYQILREALARGEPFRATFANKNKSGALYYVDQSIAPIVDDDGAVRHFVSISKDITQKVLEQQKLLEQAHRDPLTQLMNRRSGERALIAAHDLAKSNGTPFAVLLADIDHFKQVNDRHGHGIGDEVLSKVAQALQAQTREADQAIRWGGEEFLIVLNNASSQVARVAAERVRSAIGSLRQDKVGAVTVSIGCAQWRPDETLETLVDRADQALYAAKHGGRNQVVCAD